MDFEKVRQICHDYTLIGLKTMAQVRENTTTPFRFIYMSGSAAERDQTKKPRLMSQYLLMRVSTDVSLSFAILEGDWLTLTREKRKTKSYHMQQSPKARLRHV
jgi:hypothetical protein